MSSKNNSAWRSRELANLRIDGSDALVHGNRPDRSSRQTYVATNGLVYEDDGTPETARYIAEARVRARLLKGYLPLECIVDEKVGEKGETLYLAKWDGEYSDMEMTWLPAKSFRAKDLEEWKAEQVRLQRIEMDADDDNLIPDTEDADMLDDESPVSSVPVPADIATSDEPETDVNMVDVETSDDATPNTSTDIPSPSHVEQTLPAQASTSPTQSISTHQKQAQESEEEEEDVDCDDPAFATDEDIISKHSPGQRCESTTHTGKPTHTCEPCRTEALAVLDPQQQAAADFGANAMLCAGCGEHHLDAEELSFECRCLTMSQCVRCLYVTLDDLGAARAEMKSGGEECGVCRGELVGGEKVSKCALCRGLKVRF